MTPRVELRATEQMWATLQDHLYPGDDDEHGAALLCGTATVDGGTALIAREVVLAIDGIDYVRGERGYRRLTGEFVTRQIRRAHDLGLTYLAVHNHGGTDRVRFSGDDLESHERGYPTLLRVSGNPVGALVTARGAVAGDIWFTDGTRLPLSRASIVGDSRRIIRPEPQPDDRASPIFDRQALVFGDAGQAVLGGMRVAVVGAGGVGMLLIQGLARLGVGHLLVIDPERVDPTNLPRLPEATRFDAMVWLAQEGRPELVRRIGRRLASTKVRVARRIARRASGEVQVEGIVGDVADDATARRLVSADFIFLAADTMLARDVVNQIAYQYLIPTLQLGSKVIVDKHSGDVRDVYAVVRSIGTSPGCMHCNGLINAKQLGEEALGDPAQITRQRYVDEPDVHAPSVITLNALGTGWALNDFLHYAVGLGRPAAGFRLLRNRPVRPAAPQLTLQHPNARPDCHVCGASDMAVRCRGDRLELPTRITPRKTR